MAQDSQRSTSSGKPKPGPRIAQSNPADPTDLFDSNLRLALALANQQDWDQLASRTGIECFNPEPQFLSLFVEIEPAKFREKDPKTLDMGPFDHFELVVPSLYAKEYAINPALRTFAVRIELMQGNAALTSTGQSLEKLLTEAAASGFFRRLRIAVPHGQCLERSLAALDLPAGNSYTAQALTGKDIVIGIIDDGCAFAHPDFLEVRTAQGKRSYRTRVLALWDQSQAATPADQNAGWVAANVGYGRELSKAAIDIALAKHSSNLKVREDEVYKELRYDVGMAGERATHGTRVMGIAAGNGNSLMGWNGVAPSADIIFVQLPPDAINNTPKLLSHHIVHGAAYIFARARALRKKAAVINISYGGNEGPHDGTSGWEMAIDELLNKRDRAVVVSAGNSFESDCHAMGTLQPGQESSLRWILKPGDATGNDLELWYNGDAALRVWLKTPDGAKEFGPYDFGLLKDLPRDSDGKSLGTIQHVQNDKSNGDNSVTIALRPTAAAIPNVGAGLAFAPSGMWVVRLRNSGTTPAEFHGWVQRDDLGSAGARQQSRFAPDDAYPGYTLGDFATGKLTIAAGAFNAATDEVCAYSACGPTRGSDNNPPRRKPEICAPGEELATGGGVLTTGSRQAAPKRLNGTSAAAPHVAGIVALVFDYRRNHQKLHLTAAALRAALAAQAGGKPLVPDRRHATDDRRKVKQWALKTDLIGAGKISCVKTLDNL